MPIYPLIIKALMHRPSSCHSYTYQIFIGEEFARLPCPSFFKNTNFLQIQPFQRALDLLEKILSQMQVDFCRFQMLMAQKLFDLVQRYPSFYQMRGKTMPKAVYRDKGVDPRFLARPAEQRLEAGLAVLPSGLAFE